MEKKTFEITSGRIVISDPCYEVGTWCGIFNRKAKNGKWFTWVVKSDEGEWGVRVKELIAKNEDYYHKHNWKPFGSVGVESGQMSIFDRKHYKGGEGEADEDGGFYNKCCRETCKEFDSRANKKEDYDWGTVDNTGVVCASGYGDGSYDVSVIEKNNEIVAVAIRFIEDETDESDYEDDD